MSSAIQAPTDVGLHLLSCRYPVFLFIKEIVSYPLCFLTPLSKVTSVGKILALRAEGLSSEPQHPL